LPRTGREAGKRGRCNAESRLQRLVVIRSLPGLVAPSLTGLCRQGSSLRPDLVRATRLSEALAVPGATASAGLTALVNVATLWPRHRTMLITRSASRGPPVGLRRLPRPTAPRRTHRADYDFLRPATVSQLEPFPQVKRSSATPVCIMFAKRGKKNAPAISVLAREGDRYRHVPARSA